jgi:hypothetical protein
VVRQAVRTHGRRCSGVRWPNMMVEVDYDGWSRRWEAACMHVWAPCRALVQAVVVRRRDQ